ncbi:flagellar basal body-associated protein FliL [Paraglaciecola agarilytica]|uniref:flagellar basal body-associated protein FliL n=1 Tax=Paraglaciecola chathamensis TaxID=368405 RepID=UPI001C083DBE|nr:flagellar basal body-associated protein FliL [Paraglaciecola agarilytica]MBU3017246.1 flagellar basal body-associated protein FliL [Paraglaciecola agarilytica]
MAEEELQMEEGGKKSKLMMIIIIVVVLLLGGSAAAYFLLGGEDDAAMEAGAEQTQDSSDGASMSAPVKTGTALYVAIPNPITFNVPGTTRDRLVEIKVQLMVRGSDAEEQVKMHIPSIQGALNRAFSQANADDLITEAGKATIRDNALKEVQKTLKDVSGNELVEQVLFTGFVMQ